jgi:hypothetical protein
MKTITQRKLPLRVARPAYRTLQGWALGTLIEQHAVRQCEHHGYALDRGDPEAWNRAREIAWHSPFLGTSPEKCLAAIDDVVRSIGDTCPECG